MREKTIVARVSDKELRMIKEAARREGVSVSHFVRHAVLKCCKEVKKFVQKPCPECEGRGFTDRGECEFCGGLGYIFVESRG